MGITTKFRFREYTVRTAVDPLSLPTFQAVCVTGEDTDCGAASKDEHDAEALVRWVAEHFRDTGHALYERTTRATITVEPGEWK